ncbi:Protein RecT [Cupriavidus taiwanensis]|uniref:recombination protein RecT n=1 Tax=Cupriavidus taiwanensis TaxID=164546 RepID=UPI000E167B4C|nr:recombination protein RecT [Cupriavidus taiwanensis]SOZ99482.1 Protein RecT [Cupriavidus taiwanensis]
MTTISELKGGKQQQQPPDAAELRKTSKMVARDAGFGNVRKFFESQKQALLNVLPKHVSADRLIGIALGALRATPKLLECKVESLLSALVQCAQLGLEPNTPLGHAYLIPFENRRRQTVEVQIILGYKGLIDLARRSGQVISIAAHEVCERDHFVFEYGLYEKLEHRPPLTGDRGKVIAFYAVAKLKDGGHAFEVMSKEQVDAIRDASQNYAFAKDKGATVWAKHYVEMGRKTVLRRIFKYLPVSIELQSAFDLDDRASRAENQIEFGVIDGEFTVIPEDEREQSDDGDAPAQLTEQQPEMDLSQLKQQAQPQQAERVERRRAME